MKKELNVTVLMIISLFFGLILGSIFLNLGIKSQALNPLEYGLDSFNVYELVQIGDQKLFWFVCSKRFGQLAVLVLLMVLTGPKFVLNLLTGTFGAVMGIFISLETIRLGIKGAIYACACFLPHYPVYALAFLYMAFVFSKTQSYVYQKNKLAVLMLIFLGIFMVGCFLEGKISPIFLNFFYQHIVL